MLFVSSVLVRFTTCLTFVFSIVRRFAQADIHDVANDILTALFDKIESGGTPEKVSENDYLMKCMSLDFHPCSQVAQANCRAPGAMRVVITARQSLTPVYQHVLGRLVRILSVTSKNPSNPNFDQYLFEAISALIRFVTPCGRRNLAF